MPKNVFRKRGFKAHEQEEKRRKEEQESRTGKLWRFFLTKDDEPDAPVWFLTDEPVLFYEHNLKGPGGKFHNEVCTGEDCEHCADGDRPQYKGAWLIIDGREVEIDEKKDGKKTGKKRIIKDQVRLYVRGATDIAKLDRKDKRYGLLSRPWFITRVGEDRSTSYELEAGEKAKLTRKELENIFSKLPEKMKNHADPDDIETLYDIIDYNIFGDELGETSRDDEEDEDEDEEDLDEGVSSVDDDEEEEEEERPRKKLSSAKKKPGLKKKTTSSTSGKKKLFKKR